jgi:hypothetical protein
MNDNHVDWRILTTLANSPRPMEPDALRMLVPCGPNIFLSRLFRLMDEGFVRSLGANSPSDPCEITTQGQDALRNRPKPAPHAAQGRDP